MEPNRYYRRLQRIKEASQQQPENRQLNRLYLHDLYALGNEHFRRGMYKWALADYKSVVEYMQQYELDQPFVQNAYVKMGVSAMHLRNPADARKHLKSALELNANHPLALLHLGRLAFETDRLEEAAEYLERLLALQPGEDEALWLLGLVRFRRGELEEAATLFWRLSDLVGGAPAHFQLGLVMDRLGWHKPALRQVETALELLLREPAPDDGDLAGIYLELAGLYWQVGEVEQALECWEEFSSHYDADGFIWYKQNSGVTHNFALRLHELCEAMAPQQAHPRYGVRVQAALGSREELQRDIDEQLLLLSSETGGTA